MAQKMEEHKFKDEEGLTIVSQTPKMKAIIGTFGGPLTLTFTKDLSEKEIIKIVNNKDELKKAIENGTIMLAEGFEKAFDLSNKNDRDTVIGLLTHKPFGVTYKPTQIEKIKHE